MVNTRTDADLSAAVQTPCRHCFPGFAQRLVRSSVPVLDHRMLVDIPHQSLFILGLNALTSKSPIPLRRSTLNHLMCMSYTNVAQVANAARNYEIIHERDDDDTEQPDKWQKSGDRHQPTSQQSSHRNHGHNNDRHGLDRRGGSDNHRSSNNNYSGSNNRNSSYGCDQRNRGQQSNRSTNSGSQQ
nr:hypothetical protein [Tanacetum cinerariifolium]